MTEENTSLDPEDWGPFAELLQRAAVEGVDWLSTVRERPVWQAMPTAVRHRLRHGAPREGSDLEALYEEFLTSIRPYILGNIHPRFWGWVPGSGTTGGVLAELLIGLTNSVSAAWDESDRFLEQEVISWMLEVFGLPADGSGILVSGGSMANFVGLAVARDARAGFDVQAEGLGAAAKPMVLYASDATHNSVDKAVQLLGLGRRALRHLPTNDQRQLRLDALEAAILQDRAAGFAPFAVVANVGTVDAGAIDDLEGIADLCEREVLWLHVDGAFGAMVALSPRLRHRVAGLERVDSLAFDFHKWLHVSYSAGCTLFRDPAVHRAAFTVPAPYLSGVDRGTAAQPDPSHQFGPELSRETKALKIWMALKEQGLDRLGQSIERNVEQAAYLGRRIEAAPRLELRQPVFLNIVCYRYLPEDRACWSEEALDQLNREILMRLQEEGTAVPSHTVLDGRFVIRVAITSHRSRWEDFDLLVAESVRLGDALVPRPTPEIEALMDCGYLERAAC